MTDLSVPKRQVEQRRAALDADLATLLDRLPPGARLAQGAAAGGGGLAVLGFLKKRLDKRKADKKYVNEVEREATIQARAIAAAFAHAHVPTVSTQHVVPPQGQQLAVPAPAPVPAVEAPAPPPTSDVVDEDDDGSNLVLLLVLAVVGVVAGVLASRRGDDEDDLWIEREP